MIFIKIVLIVLFLGCVAGATLTHNKLDEISINTKEGLKWYWRGAYFMIAGLASLLLSAVLGLF